MRGDTTPMKVFLVVDSLTGYLGATDVDQKGVSSGFAVKSMVKLLDSTVEGAQRCCTSELNTCCKLTSVFVRQPCLCRERRRRVMHRKEKWDELSDSSRIRTE